MKFIIKCGSGYVGKQSNGSTYVVSKQENAWKIDTEQKAVNIMSTLPKLMKQKETEVICLEDEEDDKYIND